MIFKDRQDAGKKLLQVLKNNPDVKRLSQKNKKITVVSLLKGGIILGDIIAKGLNAYHLPLIVTKISSPKNPELAIGALCFSIIFLKKSIIASLGINKRSIASQIKTAKEKFSYYLKVFDLNRNLYTRKLKNKSIILVDDGAATGSTLKTAISFLRSKKPKSICLAIPVSPININLSFLDKVFILFKDFSFSAVSQYYESFPQVTNDEVIKILKTHEF